jgi:DNA replication protein DnaC
MNSRNPIEKLKNAHRKRVLEKKKRDLTLYKVLIIDGIDYLQFGEDEFSRSFSADIQTLFKKCINDLPKTSHLKY